MIDAPIFRVVAIKSDGTRVVLVNGLPESQAEAIAVRMDRLELSTQIVVEPDEELSSHRSEQPSVD